MHMKTYSVTEYKDGVATTTVLPMSPEMAKINADIQAWNAAHPNFWCKCGKPETGRIVPVGHSVDVYCANCDGCLQVG
jgi:hypothetical protein